MSNADKLARKRKATKAFWDGLSNADRHAIGDDLVLGTFDWLDWDLSPGSISLNYLDELRITWEVMQ